jgi:hypothetical protein
VKLTTYLHLVPRSKNGWSYNSTPPIRLHGVVLIKNAQRQLYLYLFTFTHKTLLRFLLSFHLPGKGDPAISDATADTVLSFIEARISLNQKKIWRPLKYLTYSLIYLFTPRCRIFFEKLIVTQLVKQKPAVFMEP